MKDKSQEKLEWSDLRKRDERQITENLEWSDLHKSDERQIARKIGME